MLLPRYRKFTGECFNLGQPAVYAIIATIIRDISRLRYDFVVAITNDTIKFTYSVGLNRVTVKTKRAKLIF